MVVDAFATWCGPCKVVAPHVVKSVYHSLLSILYLPEIHNQSQPTNNCSTHRFSEEFPDVHFTKIDVDDVPDVAQELGIRVMPTFLIFKGEEKIAEVVGANPKGLQAAIQKVVDAEKA